ncbi:Protein NLRC3 [Beauveria bassiana]|uniref:Protein NLRC3 n=1 Tax=Beauveria bassiana TaxID=176275 RepID=A0A2N6NAV7_BEABA|nr:Protein NLRC3 [Beauveria bassiana]
MAADTGQQTNSAGLVLMHDSTNADIDIIAIHGLDTKSPNTWTWKDPNDATKQINWLQNAEMLPSVVGRARIFTCDWPADMFQKSIPSTLEESAQFLLHSITLRLEQSRKAGEDRPLFFIASCLGGIILIKALEIDRHNGDDIGLSSLTAATRGIVFLATPFQGTAFEDMPDLTVKVWAAFKDQTATALIEYTKEPTPDLDELVRRFIRLQQEKDYHVFAFWEAHDTSLLSKIHLGWMFSKRASQAWYAVFFLSVELFSPWLLVLCLLWRLAFPLYQPKQLVNKSSATARILEEQRLDRCHALMNKFGDRCDDYHHVARKVKQIVEKIREGTPLEQADKLIREKHYTTDRLKIERLSGRPLAMDQCYINLAIVEQSGQDAARSKKERETAPSPFSILDRQKVEAPDKTMQVELSAIFNERKGSDDRPMHPRRILIRGRAGVGKTTLCKKIVYEFTKGTWGKWNELFDRVLWVPLRNLKHEGRRKMPVYAFEDLLSHEFLPTNKRSLAEALSRVLDAESSKTLFLLDGLDEVSQDLTGDAGMARFLNRLLSQPSVIITARPSAAPPANLDLELETIGFGPDQVNEYIEKSFTNPDTGATDQTKVGKVKSFLQERWLLQGLVRIPIQLDALCYTWDDLQPDEIPNTMTGMYKKIALKLWKKDVERLAKRHNGDLVTASQITSSDAEDLVADEVYFLEGLAFTGLHNDVIDFNAKDRDVVSTEFRRQGMLLDKVLPHLSFVRTSDPSSAAKYRSYHFIHLTFQEYFAARYFVRQWKNQGQLQFLTLRTRYDIFWRFVAGLLDGVGQALDFINTVEGEPLDLLGPTHQRLVMHCLSEISSSLPMREMLEKRLAQWLLLESTFNKTALLASEVEFPELALKISLLEESTDVQIRIMRSLANRASIPPSIIEQVAARLDHADWVVRGNTVEVLCRRSELPEAVLKAVAARLDDGKKNVRHAAVEALGRRSELPEAVLKAVAARLDDGKKIVRYAAVEALGRRSELPEAVLKAVAARLDDSDWYVQYTAVEALGRRSELPEAVLKAVAAWLDDDNEDVRRAAVKALDGRSELPEAVLKAVAARLDDSDWYVQYTAVEALGRRSELPEAMLMAVAARLDDGNWYVRHAAVEALCGRLELPEAVLMAVAARLNHVDWLVRGAAVKALGGRSELPEAVLMAVAARLNHADWLVRSAAVEALYGRLELPEVAWIDHADWLVRGAAVQALCGRSELPEAARLDDGDKNVQGAAIEALDGRSELLDAVLIAVAARINHADWLVRRAAVRALGRRLELPQPVLTAVAARVDHADWLVRRAAVKALCGRSELPEAARLDDGDENVQGAVIEALDGRSELPDTVLMAVAARLDYDDWRVRGAAVKALGRRSELPEAVLKAVAARLDDDYDEVRGAAVEALGERSELPDTVLMAVAAWVDHGNWRVRGAAVKALGRLSELPQAVLTAVAARLDDDDDEVRGAAVEALGERSELPEAVLMAVAARLNHVHRRVRDAAVEVLLHKNEKLSRILKGSLIASFYKALLERSFMEQLSWYIEEDGYYVNMPGGIVSLSVDIPQNEVREWIKGARLSIYKRWGELV